MRIEVTDAEYEAHKLADDSLIAAVEAIYADGYVVLGGVVGLDALDSLKDKLAEDTVELVRRGYDCGSDEFRGHLSQPMPRSKEHIHRDVVANPLVVGVTARILGPGVHNHFYLCNTNMPGSGRQPLHRDAPHLGSDPFNPIMSIVVNMCPIDVDESNGATELWPATHRIPGSTRVTTRDETERRRVEPPVRAVTRKGDAVLRDPRLWHRGVPNTGPSPRHMIAMVHSKSSYESETTIAVARSALELFEDELLTTMVEPVPDDYDYLSE